MNTDEEDHVPDRRSGLDRRKTPDDITPTSDPPENGNGNALNAEQIRRAAVDALDFVGRLDNVETVVVELDHHVRERLDRFEDAINRVGERAHTLSGKVDSHHGYTRGAIETLNGKVDKLASDLRGGFATIAKDSGQHREKLASVSSEIQPLKKAIAWRPVLSKTAIGIALVVASVIGNIVKDLVLPHRDHTQQGPK